MSRAATGQLDRELHCREHRTGIGAARQCAFRCKIERSAVVDRSAQDRQAQCHIDAVAEARSFERGQTLVVIHSHNAVETLGGLGNKDGVGG